MPTLLARRLSLPLAALALLIALPALAGDVPAQLPPPDPRQALLLSMSAELQRAALRLRIPDYQPPYFIAYQLKDLRSEEIEARYGALFSDETRRDRKLSVDLRVGSYDFDSSGADDLIISLAPENQTYFASKDAPLDDDAQALRNALWLVTDERYKSALASYFKKKSKGVYQADEPDRLPNFSREPPQQHVDPPLPFSFDRARWKTTARALSTLFRGHPGIFDSSVRVTADHQTRWLTSSEGTALVTEQAIFGLHVQAMARAADGQLLENSRDWYAPLESGLPDPEKLQSEVAQLLAELEVLQTAPAIDPYTGPAILAPEATGVLFHEALGHRLEGDRQDDDKEGQTFKGQIGMVLLPAFLSVIDDPTLAASGGVPLNGFYAYDDQGVRAQSVKLVDAGRLEGYLLSRHPVKPFLHSNGHARAQGGRTPVARMANLVIRSNKQVSPAELKRLLIAEAKRQGKPYGLLIKDITGGNTNTTSYGYQAFKGTPRLVYRVDVATGKEELVRGVELVGTPLSSLARILATSGESRVFNGYCGAESGFVPVSTVAPATLFSEIELQRVARAAERGPVLPSPWTGTAGSSAP